MGTRYQGTRAEVRALDAYVKLVRASESLVGRLATGLRAADELTLSQFGVLEALLHLGPMCQRELGAKILKSGGNVTMVVDNLEKRGLVKRRRSASDRRVTEVGLTAAGRAKIAAIFPRHAAEITAEMGRLTAAEQRQLGALCRKLGLGE